MTPTPTLSEREITPCGWYEILVGDLRSTEERIQQGDILAQFPIPEVEASVWPPLKDDDISVDIRVEDVVVLTQTCDLAHAKTPRIIAATIRAWKDVQNTNARYLSTDFRNSLKQGNIPRFSVLHEVTRDPKLEWSVVDFATLHVVPVQWVNTWLNENRQTPRLRMRSPYREHLSQAFARYFMRVGLPRDLDGFVSAFAKKSGEKG